MKYLKYLVIIILFSSCDTDEAEEQMPAEQYIPIGEVTYAPTQESQFIWQSNIEIANDSIFAVGAFFTNNVDEGIYVAKFNDSLELDKSVFPVNGLFQLNTRRVISHIVNDHIYITHSHTTINDSQTKMIKTNFDGEIIWEIPEINDVFITSVNNINDQIILYGFQGWGGASSFDQPLIVIFLDEEGNITNEIELGDDYATNGDIAVLNNNSLLLTCLKLDEGPDDLKPHIVNIDLQGNILWEEQLDYINDFVFRTDLFHVEVGTDGIYFSFTSRIGAPLKLGKVSLNGELMWITNVANFWSGGTFEYIEDLVLDQSNNIYLTGCIITNSSGTRRMAITKFDSNGQLIESYVHPTEGLWAESMKILNDEIITISRGFPTGLVSLIKFDYDLQVR